MARGVAALARTSLKTKLRVSLPPAPKEKSLVVGQQNLSACSTRWFLSAAGGCQLLACHCCCLADRSTRAVAGLQAVQGVETQQGADAISHGMLMTLRWMLL